MDSVLRTEWLKTELFNAALSSCLILFLQGATSQYRERLFAYNAVVTASTSACERASISITLTAASDPEKYQRGKMKKITLAFGVLQFYLRAKSKNPLCDYLSLQYLPRLPITSAWLFTCRYMTQWGQILFQKSCHSWWHEYSKATSSERSVAELITSLQK